MAARRYKNRFNLKLMVQQRLLRAWHIDAHYCAAYLKYMKEYAVLHRDKTLFVSLDDKHRLKIGEPGFPVAAVERGRQVVVSMDNTMKVADHDFTKCSLIPSGQFIVQIPESVNESFHTGDVFIGFKDAALEQSSSMRHSAELYKTLINTQDVGSKSILLLYTDGGPDHNTTFLSNKLAAMALHLMLDMDITIHMRTAPHHSWKNMVERVFAGVNIGLQAVGLMRRQGSPELESKLKNVSNLNDLRKAIGQEHQEEFAASMQPCKELLNSIIERLEWSGRKMATFDSVSRQSVTNMWDVLQRVDPTLEEGPLQKKDLRHHPDLQLFLDHCCQEKTYSFSISKCGETDCDICLPLRMPVEEFKEIHRLPDPVPGEDDRYKPFSELYGKVQTEEDLPSAKAADKRRATLPFSASAQHVKNAETVIQCEECTMWRVVYSKRKLGPREKKILQDMLQDIAFICGVSFQEDIEFPERLQSHTIEVQKHSCHDAVETLYYSGQVSDVICIRCSALTKPDWDFKSATTYPVCDDPDCAAQPLIKIRGRKK